MSSLRVQPLESQPPGRQVRKGHQSAFITQRPRSRSALTTGLGSVGLWACSSGLPRRPYRRLPKSKDLATPSPWLETPRQPPPLTEQVHQGLLSASGYVWGSGERSLEKLPSQKRSVGPPPQSLANCTSVGRCKSC